MSFYDYKVAQNLDGQDLPFHALIQAAMRKADTHNLTALRLAFPDTHDELVARYNAPGGLLPGESA